MLSKRSALAFAVALALAAGDASAQDPAPLRTVAPERGPQAMSAEDIQAAIDSLGNLDFPIRMNASRALRRAPAAIVAPALIRAVESHKDQYVRFRALVLLTAFNDNALITYLATLVPNLSETLKVAVVEGAVTGGGLTVIANAPNPAGQAILGRFFGGSVSPLKLLLSALLPTLMAILAFRAL